VSYLLVTILIGGLLRDFEPVSTVWAPTPSGLGLNFLYGLLVVYPVAVFALCLSYFTGGL
jgi:hypothetical protein